MILKDYLLKKFIVYIALAAFISFVITLSACLFFIDRNDNKKFNTNFSLYENSVLETMDILKDDVIAISSSIDYNRIFYEKSDSYIEHINHTIEKFIKQNKKIVAIYLFDYNNKYIVGYEKSNFFDEALKYNISSPEYDPAFYYDSYNSKYYAFFSNPIYINDDFLGNFVVCYDSDAFFKLIIFNEEYRNSALFFTLGDGKFPVMYNSTKNKPYSSVEYSEFKTMVENAVKQTDFTTNESGIFNFDKPFERLQINYRYLPQHDLILFFVNVKNNRFIWAAVTSFLISTFMVICFYFIIKKRIIIKSLEFELLYNAIKNTKTIMEIEGIKKTGFLEFDVFINKINEYSLEYKNLIKGIQAAANKLEASIGIFQCIPEKNIVIISEGIKDFFGLGSYFNNETAFLSFPTEKFDHIRDIIKKENINLYENIYFSETRGLKKWISFIFFDDAHNSGIIIDVTEKILKYHPELVDKNIDYVSGFFVKDIFENKLKEFISNHRNKFGCLATVEMNHYTNILEIYGERIANEYIRKAADVLTHFNDCSIIGRKTRGEFLLFVFSPEDTDKIKKNIEVWQQDALNKYFYTPDGKKFKFKFTIGYCYYPIDAKDAETLLKYSSYALYESKKIYKDAIHGFSLANFNRGMFLESRSETLEKMLDENKILYRYQPIVNLKDASIYGYECLLRSDYNIFSNPKDIIELALSEGKGYILEKLNVFNALNCIRENKEVFEKRRLFLNSLAGQNLTKEDTKRIRESYRDVRHLLVFEICSEFYDEETVVKKSDRFRNLGYRFAIDKFGEKFIDDKIIFDIDPNYIKIDRSLISDVNLKKEKQSRISRIVKYADENNIDVIAMGIETKDELYTIIKLGVRFAQGYYLSLPKFNFIDEIRQDVKKDILDFNLQ